MGRLFPSIDEPLHAFLLAQHVFFVATAPSGSDGHVNCSPKGGDSFRVLGPTTVAWLDRVGSGIETIAHLRQNARIVIMFCAFEGAPKIVRLHGRGEVIEAGDEQFAGLVARFGSPGLGVRAVIRVELTRISDSCGFGVPLYHHEGERDQLAKSAERRGEQGLLAYMREKNACSLDGLPGLRWPGDAG
ncbi:MAG TPA: pyridoxamine 5'-phosphate oxidase family protein [Planctomycetota bacterium]|nr:pyridoxamine 5'-phosphate oxidase family protein [Planctomycetota bacterium]